MKVYILSKEGLPVFFLSVSISLSFAKSNIGLQKLNVTIFGKFNIQVTFWNFP